MTTHDFTVNELINVGDETDTIFRKALDAGYTNVSVVDVNNNTTNILVSFDEADDKPTTLTNLEAAVNPILTVDNYIVEIAGDGVSIGSVLLSDSRGAGANGKTVTLEVHDGATVLPGGSTYVLGSGTDSDGQATVNFGPSPTADWYSGLTKLCFLYTTGEAKLCELTVQFKE